MDGIDRIQKVMDSVGMKQTQFAQAIKVSGPTLSVLLNRTRPNQQPTVDIYTKIVSTFPEINLEWLILGSGAMKKNTSQSEQPLLFAESKENFSQSRSYNAEKTIEKLPEKQQIEAVSTQTEKKSVENLTDVNFQPAEIIKIVEKEITVSKSVTKVIIYFSDNTFQEFLQSN
ncbi:MAG: helix-turn-helix transcriptional regulator [Paludibacter sp.]|nr:helix-turn-helix transcriptional regulator [Paludibacter sp.]